MNNHRGSLTTSAALVLLLLIGQLASAADRDPAQVREFRKTHPCPATNRVRGACPGWVVDHVVPLCFGGPDAPANMQWQETALSYVKDKFERQACALKRRCGVKDAP